MNFQVLRILDLHHCDWMKNHHIVSIGSMRQLRYLVISSKYITELPEQIGNLQHLHVMDIQWCPI